MGATRKIAAGSSPGAVLDAIRRSGVATRGDLSAQMGLARSTVGQRVDALIAHGLVASGEVAPSRGGRRPSTVRFNPEAGVVLAGDLGATHTRVGLANLGEAPLAESRGDIRIAEGPEVVLSWLAERFDTLLAEAGRRAEDVRAIGLGVPGPVEFATGRPVSPPIMPGWDAFDVVGWMRRRYDVPVLVDNDVNIAALGEQRANWPEVDHLLYLKVATGIGSGIVTGGHVYRGHHGAAGDIGHIRVAGHEDARCECGNSGCLEAVASGRALARLAREAGLDAAGSRDVVELVRALDPTMLRLVREGGRVIGEVAATLVNALNPTVIIVGGDVAQAEEHLFAGVREVIYQRSTPLATRSLQVVRGPLGDQAGVRGAAIMAIEQVLSPASVDKALATA